MGPLTTITVSFFDAALAPRKLNITFKEALSAVIWICSGVSPAVAWTVFTKTYFFRG
jgi:hypothetical protein